MVAESGFGFGLGLFSLSGALLFIGFAFKILLP
jgi:hypothetical protein